MARKVQSQLLVDLVIRQRADALAVVLGLPRAEVFRQAIVGGGLRELEATYAAKLAELDKVATALGTERLALADRMAKDGLTFADVVGKGVYPGSDQV